MPTTIVDVNPDNYDLARVLLIVTRVYDLYTPFYFSSNLANGGLLQYVHSCMNY
jgi:hypothetical protein